MGLLQAAVLAALNAVMALLPIGASGYRLFVSEVFHRPPPDAAWLLAVLIGMTLAVAVYFWRDVIALARGAAQIARGRQQAEARLLLHLLVAALPVAVAAVALKSTHLTLTASLATVGWISIGFGVLLYVGDRIGVTVRRLPHMGWGAALVIGAAQVLASIPGVGRVGIAVTLARILGFERREAGRFSLLMTLPVLAAAIALTALDAGAPRLSTDAAITGTAAFAAGLVAIAWMMAWLRERSFAIFAIWRIAAGAALLTWIGLR